MKTEQQIRDRIADIKAKIEQVKQAHAPVREKRMVELLEKEKIILLEWVLL